MHNVQEYSTSPRMLTSDALHEITQIPPDLLGSEERAKFVSTGRGSSGGADGGGFVLHVRECVIMCLCAARGRGEEEGGGCPAAPARGTEDRARARDVGLSSVCINCRGQGGGDECTLRPC